MPYQEDLSQISRAEHNVAQKPSFHKETRFYVYLMKKRQRLSSRASRSSEQVISLASSPSEVAVARAFSAASLICCHSGLQLWTTRACSNQITYDEMHKESKESSNKTTVMAENM